MNIKGISIAPEKLYLTAASLIVGGAAKLIEKKIDNRSEEEYINKIASAVVEKMRAID